MSHHSENPEDIRKLRKMIEDVSALGPTQKFPHGKLVPADEGEIRFAVAHAAGKVIIDFGKPTAWLGMQPEQAIALAEAIKRHANAVSGSELSGQ